MPRRTLKAKPTQNHLAVRKSQMDSLAEMRYVCPHEGCERAFRDQWNLEKHTNSRVHRPKPTYKYDLCDVDCKKLYVLRKHIQTAKHAKAVRLFFAAAGIVQSSE